MALCTAGLLTFLKNIIRKDWITKMWLCCEDRNRQKFAVGLLWLSAMESASRLQDTSAWEFGNKIPVKLTSSRGFE